MGHSSIRKLRRWSRSLSRRPLGLIIVLCLWSGLALAQTSDNCDRRIPVDSVQNNNGVIIIDEPGSYYFTQNVSLTGGFTDGVIINVDNVVLDLNGFTLSGDFNATQTTDDGITILSSLANIVIKNGVVRDWGGNGIDAFGCDNCSFSDLRLEGNNLDGLIADLGVKVKDCIARGNQRDGFDLDDNSLISNCKAIGNVENGIRTGQSCIIINCIATDNGIDGIDVAEGTRVEACNASGNEAHGIDAAIAGQVFNCIADRNGFNGIDLASSSLAKFNQANENGTCVAAGTCNQTSLQNGSVGCGIRTFANAQVVENICRANFYGIRINSTDGYAGGNVVTENSHAGLTIRSRNFAATNRAHNNGFTPITNANTAAGNYSFDSEASYGPIVDFSGISGELTSTTNLNHPLANLIY